MLRTIRPTLSRRTFTTIPRARVAPTVGRRSYAVAAPAVGSYGPTDEPTLNSPSELARRISAKVLPKLTKPDVKKVLVVGSGGLSIGQAGEFDYSGRSPTTYLITTSIPYVILHHHRLCYRSARSALDAERLTPRFASYQGPPREQHRHDPHQPQHRYHPDLAPPRLADLLLARHRRLCRLRAGEGAPGRYLVDIRWTVGLERRYPAGQDGCARAIGRAGAGYADQDARGVRGPRPLRSSAER